MNPEASTRYGEEHVKLAAGSIYMGGNDNNTFCLQTLLVALLLYPEVQVTAQAEINTVVGRDRLPSIADRDSLPYCAAIVEEIMRWNGPTPFALPHSLSEDEELDGYILPKGSIVMANVFGISRDPAVWDDPEHFRPERFLSTSDDGKVRLNVPRNPPAFGFGRRVCPGRHAAEAVVFAGVVTILWACTVSRPVGTEDFPIKYETYGVHWRKEFPIAFRERFPGAMELLRNSVSETEK